MRFSGEKKEEDGKLFALLEKMYRQQIRKEYGYELLMQSIFYQLKYLLVTAYRIPEEKKDYYPGNTHSGHLERITGYLREHYAEEISLETLAATFGYCPTYLSKMFRQYGRINYKDYLRSHRFEHALRELEETDLTIGEIALKNGFPNSQAFSRLFREKYGILPTEYQRRQKENDSAAFLMIQIQAESSLLGRL